MPINWSPTIDPREDSYGILENIYSIDTRGIEGIIYERLMLHMLIIGPVSRIENCIENVCRLNVNLCEFGVTNDCLLYILQFYEFYSIRWN